MEMSYSKACKVIKKADQSLGFKLLTSSTGGSNGGGSILTPEGREFLDRYLQMQAELATYADFLFAKYFQ